MITADQRRLMALSQAARTPNQILGESEPGALSGLLSAIPQGVVTGAAQVEGAVASVAARAYQPVLDAIESATGVTPWNPFASVRDQADTWAQQYRPDPMTTGIAGQAMFEISRIVTQAGAGTAASIATGGAATGAMLAGAATAGVASGRSKFLELVDKGVDPSTAANVGFVEALTIGGGVAMPASIGYGTLATPLAAGGLGMNTATFLGANIAYGAGANIAMGVAQRGATYELLQSGGYTTMAQQYAPIDAASITAEGLLGAAFAALGARGAMVNAADQALIDAAMTARDAKHAAIDTAPGLPSDPATASAHAKAAQTAMQQLLNGENVDVSGTGVLDGAFVPRQRGNTMLEAAQSEYGMDLPPASRYSASTHLESLPQGERKLLRYDSLELNQYAAAVEERYGLPSGLINAIKNAGERSNSNQTSPAGARGVMQFMPENLEKYGVTDPTDPAQMIDAAGRYLRDTQRQYGGNLEAMIADYNGGPRQAREVLAGRQPKAKETREYLQRVRQWLGRDRDPHAVTRASDDVPTVDLLPQVPAEQARAARAIDAELAALETERAGLLADAGNMADIGRVTEIRAELVDLQAQRQAIEGDSSLRELAKEIQSTTPRTSYKQALSLARRQRNAEITDLDNRIGRLEGAIRENARADQAAQRLARITEEETALRANREAIGETPPVEAPVSAAVRSALNDTGLFQENYTPLDAGRPAGADRPAAPVRQPAAAPRPAPLARAAEPDPGAGAARNAEPQADAAAARQALEAADDPETRAGLALLDEQGDIVVPIELENGETVNVSMRAALAEADAEMQYVRPETLNAAVVCAMTRGA